MNEKLNGKNQASEIVFGTACLAVDRDERGGDIDRVERYSGSTSLGVFEKEDSTSWYWSDRVFDE